MRLLTQTVRHSLPSTKRRSLPKLLRPKPFPTRILRRSFAKVGVGKPIPDGDPLPPFEDVPQAEDAALIAKLAADAPKASFYEGDGLWLRYPSANRMVRAGDPREGDPQIHFEGVALHQGATPLQPQAIEQEGGATGRLAPQGARLDADG